MATCAAVMDPEVRRRGRRLQLFTIAYNALEGVIALVAGMAAGSVSLIGFGIDSVIEITSAGAALWGLERKADGAALRLVAVCFLALAGYIGYESVESLLLRQAPERSIAGIILAACSVVIMPALARAKRQVGKAASSQAMQADARQTDFCAYLSGIVLVGLSLNALFGWWWADPAAALAMVPIIAAEGVQALKGKACGCGH